MHALSILGTGIPQNFQIESEAVQVNSKAFEALLEHLDEALESSLDIPHDGRRRIKSLSLMFYYTHGYGSLPLIRMCGIPPHCWLTDGWTTKDSPSPHTYDASSGGRFYSIFPE